MANVTLKGNPIHTVGELPKVGSPGPNFCLTRGDLSDISLAGFEAKVEILNIVPASTPAWGRPAPVAVAKDGTLLIADDTGGTIWRVAYAGNDGARKEAAHRSLDAMWRPNGPRMSAPNYSEQEYDS